MPLPDLSPAVIALVLDIARLELAAQRQLESEIHMEISATVYPIRERIVLSNRAIPPPSKNIKDAPVDAELEVGIVENITTSNEKTEDKVPTLFPVVREIRRDCLRFLRDVIEVMIVSDTQNVASAWDGLNTLRTVGSLKAKLIPVRSVS